MEGKPVEGTTQWLSEHDQAMFECPRLPGHLRLSPQACSVRYLKANGDDFANLERSEWCAIGLKMSLAVCRGCAVGCRHAKGNNSKPAGPRRGRLVSRGATL
ncbi:MAG: hypothetical protein V2A77_11365 [Pseudomonadota bacterium]